MWNIIFGTVLILQRDLCSESVEISGIEFHKQFPNCLDGGDSFIVDDETAALLTALYPEEFPANERETVLLIDSGIKPNDL